MFGLDFIRKLKPCKWRYVGTLDDGVEHFGFIAQDVNDIAPEDKYGFVVMRPDGFYALVLGEFIGPIVKSVQELDEKVALLERRLDGITAPHKLGDDEVSHNDPVGNRHDLEANLGDV
jgi:hypothetical protein